MLVSAPDAWHHDVMGEIVNLRRVRKAKAREAAAEQAAASRAKHGQSKAERTVSEQARMVTERALDRAKIVVPSDE